MYRPQATLLEGVKQAFPLQLFPWDDYFARMAETDFLSGRADVFSVKSFFIREAPFGGSYALLGGITEALRTISELRFDDADFQKGMLEMGYKKEFVSWLKDRKRIRIQVWSPPEGSVFFPHEPVVTFVGPLVDVRLVEGIIIEALNFSTLSLTKWYRMVRAARPGRVLEFSRRRAQNSLKASLYGMLAGCYATSNSELRRHFDVPVTGTMGHEWVQSFGDVGDAFDTWLSHQPDRPIGLVDTKHCLKHDFPLWLNAVYKHRERIKNANPPVWGWRNDSGDLAFLTIEQYFKFLKHPLAQDEWFRERQRIALTNELDEFRASSLVGQISTQVKQQGHDPEALIGRIIWAAGTRPGTCEGQPALGGVAKLMEVEKKKACIKLAFNEQGKIGPKTSIPGFNFSAFVRDASGEIQCVLLYPARRYGITKGKLFDSVKDKMIETLVGCHPSDPGSNLEITGYTVEQRQKPVFDTMSWTNAESNGFTLEWDNPTIHSVAERVVRDVDQLSWWMTRLEKPHSMKISLTPELFDMRQQMIKRELLQDEYPSW